MEVGRRAIPQCSAWEPGRQELGMHCDAKCTPKVQPMVQSLQRSTPGHEDWCQLSTSLCLEIHAFIKLTFIELDGALDIEKHMQMT